MKYFLDTNFISDLANKKDFAVKKFKQLNSEGAEFYINQLVFIEALRAIPINQPNRFEDVKKVIDICVILYEQPPPAFFYECVNFSRFCKSKGLNLGKCEAIDYLHFITAKYYKLQIISDDNDMKALEGRYQEFCSKID